MGAAKNMPAGTRVSVRLDDGTNWETRTRSEPWVLGDGKTWVVKLEGKTGGYDLRRVTPVEPDRALACPICEGFGVDPETVTEHLKGDPCKMCGGKGVLPVADPKADRGIEAEKTIVDELVDNGLDREDVERRRAS